MGAASIRITTTTSPISPTEPRTLEPVGDCSIPDCPKTAFGHEGGLCSMHARRKRRGVDPGAPVQDRLSPWARVINAAFDLYDSPAESDDDYQRRELALRMAIVRWIRKNGWSKKAETVLLAHTVRSLGEVALRGSPKHTPSAGRPSVQARRQARKTVAEGRLTESRRPADLGAGDAHARRQPRAGSDHPVGAADAAEAKPERGPLRGRGIARPSRTQALQPRAGKNRVER